MKALRAVQLADTRQGPIRLDAYGNPMVNVDIDKVERARAAHDAVIDTYRDVTSSGSTTRQRSWRRRTIARLPAAKNIE